MALIVKKATLGSHLSTVLVTPFAIVAFKLLTERWKLALIAVICVGMLAAGAMKLALPSPAEIKEQLIIGSVVVCFFWIAAAFLTALDRIRFRGLTHAPADSSIIDRAESFLGALFQRNGQDPQSFLAMRLRNNRPEVAELIWKWRRALDDCSVMVSAAELHTTDEVIFRQALGMIENVDLQAEDFILLVPLVSDLNLPVGATMKCAAIFFRPKYSSDIESLQVLDIQRPAILR